MKENNQPKLRLSSLLIEELVDADHNCPFRMGTPLFLVLSWYATSQKPIEQIEEELPIYKSIQI